MRTRSITLVVCIVALFGATIQALAQAQEQRREAPAVFTTAVQGGQGGDGYIFVASEMSFDRKLVKGAPYSAVGVTETIQALADGNRIVHKSSASVYRDSEGRTRREQVLAKIGPYASAGDTPQTIFINDPNAEVNYILEPGSRTARKMSMPNVVLRRTPEGPGADKIRSKESVELRAVPPEVRAISPGERERIEVTMQAANMGVGAGAATWVTTLDQGGRISSKNANKESLGKQMVEGVEAEGTRVTITIAAGEIGNDAPINIISESWYSPELQVVVKSRHSDPRSGETVYRLTNINRSEPDHSLFEVPSDYSIKDQPGADMKMRFEKEVQVQQRRNDKQ